MSIDDEKKAQPEASAPETAASTSTETAEGPALPADSGKTRSRSGRGLGVLALLLAVGALVAAGYLYYQLLYLNPTEEVAAEVDSTEADVAQLESRVSRLVDDQSGAMEVLRAEVQQQADQLAATEESLVARLNEISRQGPPDPQEWRLAEAQYLLRIANHRLLMERDVSSSLQLLQAADQILVEMEDFALHPVRARLADEILALERVEGVDVQGIFLRLEALKGALDELPLRLPEYLARNEQPQPPPGGFWQTLKTQLQSYLQLRRFDGSVKPLLAPEEGVYLELNLRLMLERAQLAALRRNQVIYTQSLATAQQWIEDYLDPESATVQRIEAELQALGQVSLDRPLPDISGSLNALNAVLRGES
jgi:uroporphyrin-3 C-methyltransferase